MGHTNAVVPSLLPEGARGGKRVTAHGGPIALYLEELGIKYIDLFSSDVEGAELDVLETIDFSNIKVHHLGPIIFFNSHLGLIATGHRIHFHVFRVPFCRRGRP